MIIRIVAGRSVHLALWGVERGQNQWTAPSFSLKALPCWCADGQCKATTTDLPVPNRQSRKIFHARPNSNVGACLLAMRERVDEEFVVPVPSHVKTTTSPPVFISSLGDMANLLPLGKLSEEHSTTFSVALGEKFPRYEFII